MNELLEDILWLLRLIQDSEKVHGDIYTPLLVDTLVDRLAKRVDEMLDLLVMEETKDE